MSDENANLFAVLPKHPGFYESKLGAGRYLIISNPV